jgi:hypothetical protein
VYRIRLTNPLFTGFAYSQFNLSSDLAMRIKIKKEPTDKKMSFFAHASRDFTSVRFQKRGYLFQLIFWCLIRYDENCVSPHFHISYSIIQFFPIFNARLFL